MGENAEYLVVFVCTGNTCRSPLAEGALRKLLPDSWRDRVEILSAGVSAVPGVSVSRNSDRVAARNGIDISAKRSIPLSAELARRADLLIAMESSHVRALEGILRGRGTEKIVLLRDLLPLDDPTSGTDIPDPFGGSLEEYEQTFRQIWSALSRGWPAIEKRLRTDRTAEP
jgi:protein-tyrosine phosphatase